MSGKQPASRVAVDDAEYSWEYRHGWLVDWGSGLKGISVSVALNPGKTRELILDFSFGTFGLERNPPLAFPGVWRNQARSFVGLRRWPC